MRLFSALDAERAQTIALSAVAQKVESPLAAWVAGADSDEPIKTEYRSTRQLVGRLECASNRFRIEYDLLDGANLRVAGSDGEEALYIANPFPPCPPTRGFDGPEKSLRPYVFWAATHLAAPDKDGRQRAVLVSVAERPEGYAEDLLTLLDRTWAQADVPTFFRMPEEGDPRREVWKRCIASCADYFGRESREYRLLVRGVVVHHGKMPGLLARLLIQVIDEGIIHLVIATSTLTEGVNLPFDTILVPTLRRYNGDMSPQEFANLLGRAGRPMRTVEGRTLVVLRTDARDWSSIQARTRYGELIRAIGLTSQAEQAEPRSALAELIEHLEDAWRQVHKDGTPTDFAAWLEATLPATATEGTTGDAPIKEDREIDALDALDGVLLPAVVEIELLRDGGLSPGALEEGLMRIWRNSYAHYASAEQERLGQLFVLRGKALATSVYSDAAARKRIYCTSLPPRHARVLLAVYPQVRAVLEAGSEYGRWNAEQRLAYVQTLVEALSSVPAFAVQPPRRMGARDPWDPLRWWLLGAESTMRPRQTQVTAWHAYVANNFTYRFSWGLGGILATAAHEAHAGALRETSLDDWGMTRLPWIALWLKELVLWGTLEPVAAYLLAKGFQFTRPAAEAGAGEYYEFRGPQAGSDDLLDPRKVRAWVEARYGKREEARYSGSLTFRAQLNRDFTGQPAKLWRVVPGFLDGTIYWFDPAGHLLAKSSGVDADGFNPSQQSTHDFVIDPKKGLVTGRLYLLS